MDKPQVGVGAALFEHGDYLLERFLCRAMAVHGNDDVAEPTNEVIDLGEALRPIRMLAVSKEEGHAAFLLTNVKHGPDWGYFEDVRSMELRVQFVNTFLMKLKVD